MRDKPRMILSQLRLPFRHFGWAATILTTKVVLPQSKSRRAIHVSFETKLINTMFSKIIELFYKLGRTQRAPTLAIIRIEPVEPLRGNS